MIRPEQPDDLAQVYHVNQQAFGGNTEAELVDKLRAHGKATISLVALEDDLVVGHILFSAVRFAECERAIAALGLAPLAVLPAYQRRGIGSRLIAAGLEKCRNANYESVVVLGHPNYYPRFGFVPASRYGLACEYTSEPESFMVIELRRGALQGCRGLVKYEPEFEEA